LDLGGERLVRSRLMAFTSSKGGLAEAAMRDPVEQYWNCLNPVSGERAIYEGYFVSYTLLYSQSELGSKTAAWLYLSGLVGY
jgi:hypothetical protein